jgi:exosortase
MNGRAATAFDSYASASLVFSGLVIVSLALWYGPLSSLFDSALSDEQFTHIILILPISATLLYVDWKKIGASAAFDLRFGSELLIFSLALTAAAHWGMRALSPDARLSLAILALVAWWIGSFILCFGVVTFRRARFPLLFLLWMVPFPDFVLNPIVNFLQHGSTVAAQLFFAAARVAVERQGTLLHISGAALPGVILEVAPECSSIRSSMMLLITTMVLAQLLLRVPWRKALLILAAIPLAIAKNGLRIFVLGMLATRVDPDFLTGRLHRQGGVIFLLAAFVGVILLLWVLRQGERHTRGVIQETI